MSTKPGSNQIIHVGQPLNEWLDSNVDTELRADLASGDAGKGSELIAHKLSAVGSTVRSLFEKISEFVSVKDFGAVGDGVTDDTTPIQSALATGKRVHGASGEVYKITSPLYISTANTEFNGNGCEIRHIAVGVPAFIVSANYVTIQNTKITNTATKPGTGSSGPYRDGIVYHSGVLQTSGDFLTVKDCVFTDWTAGVGFHGAQDLVTRSKSLRITGNTFIRHDFGALIRQFDGANFSSNIGYDCEETVEPAHLLYVTDRGTVQSRNLIVAGNIEENNSSSDSIKVRNVKGFSIANNVSRNCVRGIYVGFCEKGVVTGNSITDLQLRPADTSATGINVDDSLGIQLIGNIIDIDSVGSSGIRIRSDVGTFGNKEIFSANNVIYFDGTTSVPTPYRVDSQTDFFSTEDVFVNKGTNHSRFAFRLFNTTRSTITSPVLRSNPAISNSRRIVEIDAACTATRLFVNATSWSTWDSSNSVSDAGTGSVVSASDALLARVGSVSAPSISFAAATTTGLYRPSTNTLGVAANGILTCSFVSDRVQPEVNVRPGTDNSLTLGSTAARWQIVHSFNVRTHAVTVANLATLPGAAVGARAFVTDANATTFGSIVSGGGANSVPVYHDGANWRIG